MGAPSCYLKMLDKQQKRAYGTVVPSTAASLEPLAHCQDFTSLYKWGFFCSIIKIKLYWLLVTNRQPHRKHYYLLNCYAQTMLDCGTLCCFSALFCCSDLLFVADNIIFKDEFAISLLWPHLQWGFPMVTRFSYCIICCLL